MNTITKKQFDKMCDTIIKDIESNPDSGMKKIALTTCQATFQRMRKELFKKDNSLKIKIKYFNDTYNGDNSIKLADKKCNWIDLRASEDVHLEKGEFKLIPLGIAMKLPKGYEAHIVPRSSTFKTWGIIETNSMGVIDETYCGKDDQWFFPAYATRLTDIKKGDRICQFRIEKHQPKFEFVEDSLEDNDNRGGHGSTGTN